MYALLVLIVYSSISTYSTGICYKVRINKKKRRMTVENQESKHSRFPNGTPNACDFLIRYLLTAHPVSSLVVTNSQLTVINHCLSKVLVKHKTAMLHATSLIATNARLIVEPCSRIAAPRNMCSKKNKPVMSHVALAGCCTWTPLPMAPRSFPPPLTKLWDFGTCLALPRTPSLKARGRSAVSPGRCLACTTCGREVSESSLFIARRAEEVEVSFWHLPAFAEWIMVARDRALFLLKIKQHLSCDMVLVEPEQGSVVTATCYSQVKRCLVLLPVYALIEERNSGNPFEASWGFINLILLTLY